jgi:DNA-directed RNA polymerase subunit M/transcription elongation factor TFIIS
MMMTIKTPLMMAEEKRKRNTVVCPKCGRENESFDEKTRRREKLN